MGYFDLHDLQKIHEKEAYYISRLKLNSRIYHKNDNPGYFRNGTVKKGTLYTQLDMEELMNQLSPGQTMGSSEAYIGQYQKLPARVIIHDLYSLRWQIEILFKTWKSFFQIDKCKEIKKERLECHLYGQLISILLCSSTMFKMRQLLLHKKKKELSGLQSILVQLQYCVVDSTWIQVN
ncbi:Transposase DDE domain protein [Bacillus subtilis]|nr:Transposase DDE domain protein [Bacillus subtilis]